MPEPPPVWSSPKADGARAPVVIIGGGISGLACAVMLRQRRIPFLLLEQSARLGGLIHTAEDQGYLVECGPQSFTLTPALYQLIADAALAGELLYAPRRAPRYIWRHGQLLAAPMSPLALFTTPLLDGHAKWRLVTEPLGTSHPPAGDESVADFVRRKFGSSLLENLVAPLVSGIYAGDPEKISLRAALPQAYEWERKHGSLLRGAVRRKREKAPGGRAPRGLCSLRRGMSSLPEALSKLLGEGVQIQSSATAVALRALGSSTTPAMRDQARFDVRVARRGQSQTVAASAVVVAVEPQEASQVLRSASSETSALLATIASAPVAVCALGYRRGAIARSLEGFGFLVPRGEGLRLLGTVWNSSLFPARAPQGHVLLTSFLGGALDPEIVTWPEERISAAVHNDLARVLQVREPPAFTWITRHLRALPQYNLGHAQTVASLAERCAKTPGLFLAGNYLTGPSLGACVLRSFQVAQSVEQLISPPSAPGA
jgi:protoporphyrinogen/coproporphyrinogen III oxidase